MSFSRATSSSAPPRIGNGDKAEHLAAALLVYAKPLEDGKVSPLWHLPLVHKTELSAARGVRAQSWQLHQLAAVTSSGKTSRSLRVPRYLMDRHLSCSSLRAFTAVRPTRPGSCTVSDRRNAHEPVGCAPKSRSSASETPCIALSRPPRAPASTSRTATSM